MKKIRFLLTLMCLYASMSFAYDFSVDGIYYRVISSKDLTVAVTSDNRGTQGSREYFVYDIYGYGFLIDEYDFIYPSYAGSVIIPETVSYNGLKYNVVSIDDYTFTKKIHRNYDYKTYYMKSPVTSISLPETITSIGAHAFMGCQITEIKLPTNITDIPDEAFYATPLTTIEIPQSVKTIGTDAFRKCNLHKVVIPSGVEEIGSNAFLDCTDLTMAFLLNNKVEYNNSAFPTNTLCFVPSDATTIPQTNVVNMVSFSKNEQNYNGEAIKDVTFTNNLKRYDPTMEMTTTMGTLEKKAGAWTTMLNAHFSNSNDIDFEVEIPYTYTIHKQPLTLTVNDATREYGDDNPTFTYKAEGFVNNETSDVLNVVLNTTATKTSNAGTYEIDATITSDNYDVTVKKGTLSVTKAPLTAMVENKTKTYGDENPSFTMLLAGFKNGDTAPGFTTQPTYKTTVTKTSGVGEYVISASGAEATNYEISNYQSGKLTIKKAQLTITPNALLKYYGDENPDVKFNYNGFLNDEKEDVLTHKPVATIDANSNTPVGTYGITASGATADNYDITYNTGTLTVLKAPLTIKAENKTKVYGETNPELTVIYSGFKNREDASVLKALPIASCSATKTSDVGKYTITVYGASAENYDITYQSGTLSVTQAPQLISWNQDFSKVTHNDVMELNASSSSLLAVTYSASNTSVANVYTQSGKTYVKFIQPGKVSVTAKQTGSTNYASATPITKDIVVEPLHVNSINLNRTSFEGNKGSSVSLTASVSPSNASNTSVTWRSSNTSVATVSSTGYVNIVGLGECTITATSDDNSTIKATCSIKCVPTRHDVVLANAGYATFYDSKENYIIPAGITAQVITGLTNDGLKYSTIADGNTNKNIIPKATAVMLVNERKTGGTFTLVSTDNVASYTGINYLAGSDSYTKPSGTSTYFYKLAYSNSSLNKFGWYWGASNGAAFYINGHKAWLALPKTYASSAKASEFLLEDFEPTAVENVEATTEVEKPEYYDVAGRKLNNAPQKGIFILNGKTHLK